MLGCLHTELLLLLSPLYSELWQTSDCEIAKFRSSSSGLSCPILDCDRYPISKCDYSSLDCAATLCGLWLVALFDKTMIGGIGGIALAMVSQGRRRAESRLLIGQIGCAASSQRKRESWPDLVCETLRA